MTQANAIHTQAIEASARSPKRAWPLIMGLIMLGLLPLVANGIRRLALALDPAATAEDTPLSLPVTLHLVGATVFVIVGALQFSARLRRSKPAWHRNAGRMLIGMGLLTAFTGVWLGIISANDSGSGELLLVIRVIAGLGMALSVVLGFAAIRRRDIRRHRAWMTRAVALGLGAGTQLFTLGFGQAIFGATKLSDALLNGAGWAINLVVAEGAIRRRPPTPPINKENRND